MAKIHKGELEIENGLGLPKKTTAQISTTSQPDGYLTYNTTDGELEIRSGSSWKKIAFTSDVATGAGQKVSIAGDTMTGNLVLEEASIVLESDSTGIESRLNFSLDSTNTGFVGEDNGKISLSSSNRDLALSAGTADLTVSAGNVSLTGSALTVNTTATFTSEVSVPTPTNAANPVTLGYFQANSSYTLAGLTDTTITTPASGEALFYNGSAWVNRDVVLADISDFDATAYATGAEGDLASTAVQPTDSIDVLADVDTSTSAPTSGQALTWDGSAFVPTTLTGGDDRVLRAGDTMTGTLELAGDNASTGGQLVLSDSAGEGAAITFPDGGVIDMTEGGQIDLGSAFESGGLSIAGVGSDGIEMWDGAPTAYYNSNRGVYANSTSRYVNIDHTGIQLASGEGDALGGANADANITFTQSEDTHAVTPGIEWVDTSSATVAGVKFSPGVEGAPGVLNVSAGSNTLSVRNAETLSNTVINYTGAISIAAIDAADAKTLVTREYVADKIGAVSGSAVTDLDGLIDVTLTSEAQGEALFYDGSVWVNRVIAKSDVSGFSDADYATAAQGLLADSALQDLTASSIGTLSDVDITSIDEGDFLVWDNTAGEFVPGQVADTDLTNYVTLDGVQTITGLKTFNAGATLPVDASLTIGSATVSQATNDALKVINENAVISLENNDIQLRISSDAGLQMAPTSVRLSTSGSLTNLTLTDTLARIESGSCILEMGAYTGSFTLTSGFNNVLTTPTSVSGSTVMTTDYHISGPAFVGGEADTILTTKKYVDDIVGAAGGAIDLGDLRDVTVGTTAAGHAVMRNAGDTAWENRFLVEADISDFGSYAIAGHVHTKSEISDFEETDYVHVTGDESIAGEKTFADDATFSANVAINGDLTVGGTTTTVNSTNLDITDSIIKLNKGESGAGVTNPNQSGLEIDRGTEDNVAMIWSESNDRFGYADVDGSGDITVASFKAFAFADEVASNSAVVDFVIGDWSAGEYTVLQATHGVAASKIYHVTVIEGGDIVGIETSINASGDVTLKTSGAAFAGSVRISL